MCNGFIDRHSITDLSIWTITVRYADDSLSHFVREPVKLEVNIGTETKQLLSTLSSYIIQFVSQIPKPLGSHAPGIHSTPH